MREITNQVAPEPFRWTAEALLATQEVRSGIDHGRNTMDFPTLQSGALHGHMIAFRSMLPDLCCRQRLSLIGIHKDMQGCQDFISDSQLCT